MQRQQFKDNFKPFLRGNNQVLIEIEVLKLITDPALEYYN